MSRRMPAVVTLIGTVLAAAAAHAADYPKAVTLFGQKYSVVSTDRAVTYKNGVKITIDTAGNSRAALDFVQGADPSADRLFVGCDIAGGDVADQLYVLTGADPNTGVFDATNSNATQFFGGAVNDDDGGRVTSVLFLHDPPSNVAVGKDRNLALVQFSGPDELQFYDVRNITGGNFVDDSLFGRYIGGDASSTDFRHGQDTNPTQHQTPDDNLPYQGFVSLAHGPNGTLVATGQNQDGTNLEMGVMDPTKDTFFPVKTDLAMVTANSTIKLADAKFGPALVQMGPDEYWMLTTDADPGGNGSDATSEPLYRLKVTFPADLTKSAPNSIKVEVMGVEDLFKQGLNAAAATGIYGLTGGRPVTANGARRLYMADYEGHILTLTPTP
jgi:hypothetical protein